MPYKSVPRLCSGRLLAVGFRVGLFALAKRASGGHERPLDFLERPVPQHQQRNVVRDVRIASAEPRLGRLSVCAERLDQLEDEPEHVRPLGLPAGHPLLHRSRLRDAADRSNGGQPEHGDQFADDVADAQGHRLLVGLEALIRLPELFLRHFSAEIFQQESPFKPCATLVRDVLKIGYHAEGTLSYWFEVLLRIGEYPSSESLLCRPSEHGHFVQFYQADESHLIDNVARYCFEGLHSGESAVVIATPQHREELLSRIQQLGCNAADATRSGRLNMLDADMTLERFMLDGMPSRARFEESVGSLLRSIDGRARAFGEMVGMLWQRKQRAAAMHLEEFWNALQLDVGFSLFCAYPIDVFGSDFELGTIDAVMCGHTHLLPAGPDDRFEAAINDAMEEVLGSRLETMRALIKANYRPAWAALPRAEAIVLWLRNNLPEVADAIVQRARERYRPANRRALWGIA